MKNFRYFSPSNLDEVLSLLEAFGEKAFMMAGGTDLLVRLKNGEKNPECVIDLKKISQLDRIEYDDHKGLRIGSLSPIASVEKYPAILKYYKALAEAASTIGSAQIRNKGTVGGNLCNASPSADMAPPLIVMGATVRTFGRGGERIISLDDFFLEPGKTALQKNEVLIEIQVPKLPLWSGATYLKFSRRGGLDLAVVGVACLLVVDVNSHCQGARIAMGAVAPTPVRAKKAETLLIGKKISDELIRGVAEVASEEAQPISDIRGSATYRKEIVKVLVKRSLLISMEKIKSSEKHNEA